MANVSDAFGEIEIRVKAKTVDEEKRLIGNMKKLFDEVMSGKGGAYYSTEIEEFDCELGDGGILDWVGRGKFRGLGRWAFEANCRYTYGWLKHGVEVHKELEPLFNELNNYDWSITYDFVDAEGGCGVLYEMVAVVNHKQGEDRADMSVQYVDDYEYTPENLVKLNFYDNIDNAKEACE